MYIKYNSRNVKTNKIFVAFGKFLSFKTIRDNIFFPPRTITETHVMKNISFY